MDFRAGLISGISSVLALIISVGLILLCMLFARASCQPVRNNLEEKVFSSITQIMEEIKIALKHLSAPELLPTNLNCSLNMTELQALEKQQPLRDHISNFSCYMQKFSKNVPQLSEQFREITQVMQDMERKMQGKTGPKNCSLPAFKERLYNYNNAKCFLQLVQKTLTNPML